MLFASTVTVESFQLMMDAGNYLPEHLQPWLLWMQLSLFAAPLFFIKYVAPRYLILAQVINTLVAYAVFVGEGHQVTKLFGIGHFVWLWPLWLFVRDVRNRYGSTVYRTYAWIVILTISVSLVFDIRDTSLWIMGDRDSILVTMPSDPKQQSSSNP